MRDNANAHSHEKEMSLDLCYVVCVLVRVAVTSSRQIKPRRSTQPSIYLLLSANQNRLPLVFISEIPVFLQIHSIGRKIEPGISICNRSVYPGRHVNINYTI